MVLMIELDWLFKIFLDNFFHNNLFKLLWNLFIFHFLFIFRKASSDQANQEQDQKYQHEDICHLVRMEIMMVDALQESRDVGVLVVFYDYWWRGY